MKKPLTPLEQENCDRNCAECWESDCFGNCYKKCENCEFDGSENCYFGQWCKYWDGHGIPSKKCDNCNGLENCCFGHFCKYWDDEGNLKIPFEELPEHVQQEVNNCSIDTFVSDGDLPF